MAKIEGGMNNACTFTAQICTFWMGRSGMVLTALRVPLQLLHLYGPDRHTHTQLKNTKVVFIYAALSSMESPITLEAVATCVFCEW